MDSPAIARVSRALVLVGRVVSLLLVVFCLRIVTFNVGVYNIIPSISSVTGISPQRYLWRASIAFHMGPRVLIAWVYREYYRTILTQTSGLLTLASALSYVEIAALCGVTYVSNRENYPVHEKIFITFMISSLSYMLANVKLFKQAHPNMTPQQQQSYHYKKILFAVSILATIGLFVFFLKHRFLCHVMAFSWFSMCEYLIATCNMAYHVTVILDFPDEVLTVSRPRLKAH